ncbi:hypothetical protein HK405_012395 [Cladochytrium tenue]|nr:hypothetical protein HK405_012395 [Cladochytrium tenue]
MPPKPRSAVDQPAPATASTTPARNAGVKASFSTARTAPRPASAAAANAGGTRSSTPTVATPSRGASAATAAARRPLWNSSTAAIKPGGATVSRSTGGGGRPGVPTTPTASVPASPCRRPLDLSTTSRGAGVGVPSSSSSGLAFGGGGGGSSGGVMVASGSGSTVARRKVAEAMEAVLGGRYGSDRELRAAQKRLRRMVVADGIPDDEVSRRGMLSSGSGLRGRVWKALLGVYRVSALEYATLCGRGASEVYERKIKNDTFRTLATDAGFAARVDEGMIARVLNAFVWKVKDQPPSRLINLHFSYVQGMNVLAAPFLYVMPELDAFYSFLAFIQHSCPLYVQPSLEGVHCGVKLFDICLKHLDPALHRHLKSKRLEAVTYAFPCEHVVLSQ